MTTIDYWEKRDFIRMMVDAPMQYQLAGQSRMHNGTIIDLSATGLAFKAETDHEKGALLSVMVDSSSSKIPPLSADARVLRCEQSLVPGIYRVSCRIEKMAPGDYEESESATSTG